MAHQSVVAALGTSARAELVAMARRLATAIDDPNTSARDLAALTNRLMVVSKEIRAIDDASSESEVGNAVNTPDESWAVA